MKDLLLTPDDFKNYFDVGDLREEKIRRFIWQAQTLELRALVGCDVFFGKMIKTPSEFAEMLNGGFFTYKEQEYYVVGLRAVLALLVYGVMIKDSEILTEKGSVTKLSEESQPTPRADRYKIYADNVNKATELYQAHANLMSALNYKGYSDLCAGDCEQEGVGTPLFEVKVVKKAY